MSFAPSGCHMSFFCTCCVSYGCRELILSTPWTFYVQVVLLLVVMSFFQAAPSGCHMSFAPSGCHMRNLLANTSNADTTAMNLTSMQSLEKWRLLNLSLFIIWKQATIVIKQRNLCLRTQQGKCPDGEKRWRTSRRSMEAGQLRSSITQRQSNSKTEPEFHYSCKTAPPTSLSSLRSTFCVIR